MRTTISVTLDTELVKEAREKHVPFSNIFDECLKKHLEKLRRNTK